MDSQPRMSRYWMEKLPRTDIHSKEICQTMYIKKVNISLSMERYPRRIYLIVSIYNIPVLSIAPEIISWHLDHDFHILCPEILTCNNNVQ